MNLELGSFENRKKMCLLYILVLTGCVRDTGASIEQFLQRRIHTSNTSVDSNNFEII